MVPLNQNQSPSPPKILPINSITTKKKYVGLKKTPLARKQNRLTLVLQNQTPPHRQKLSHQKTKITSNKKNPLTASNNLLLKIPLKNVLNLSHQKTPPTNQMPPGPTNQNQPKNRLQYLKLNL